MAKHHNQQTPRPTPSALLPLAPDTGLVGPVAPPITTPIDPAITTPTISPAVANLAATFYPAIAPSPGNYKGSGIRLPGVGKGNGHSLADKGAHAMVRKNLLAAKGPLTPKQCWAGCGLSHYNYLKSLLAGGYITKHTNGMYSANPNLASAGLADPQTTPPNQQGGSGI